MSDCCELFVATLPFSFKVPTNTTISQSPKRVKTEKKFTGSKIGAIFCKIASRITTQNLKIGP